MILFGTKNKTSTDAVSENVFTLVPLEVPIAKSVSSVGAAAEEDFDPSSHPFGGSIAPSETCPLKDALFTCSQVGPGMFTVRTSSVALIQL